VRLELEISELITGADWLEYFGVTTTTTVTRKFNNYFVMYPGEDLMMRGREAL
jgi:hypothetical protein